MDIEKTMQFLLDQQARFDARQAQFEERQARFEESMARSFAQINAILVDIAAAQERTSRIVATLTEKHIELAESHKTLNESHRIVAESHASLAKAHEATEEALHSLIATVEQHTRDHR
jgi:hypothetical protein